MPGLHGVFDIVFRTLVIYVFLLVGVRLSGKREIGQLMPFDFVLLLVLSNSVQNAMVGPDNSLLGGIVAATTLLIITKVLNVVGRHAPAFRRRLTGSPTRLVLHGLLLHQNLEREGMSTDELYQALREHEVTDLADVELATLELDGNISVIRRQNGGQLPRMVKSRKRLRRLRYSQ
jgi:uncharacterized membrane protein YcaP (DUF421 family)